MSLNSLIETTMSSQVKRCGSDMNLVFDNIFSRFDVLFTSCCSVTCVNVYLGFWLIRCTVFILLWILDYGCRGTRPHSAGIGIRTGTPCHHFYRIRITIGCSEEKGQAVKKGNSDDKFLKWLALLQCRDSWTRISVRFGSKSGAGSSAKGERKKNSGAKNERLPPWC